MDNGIAVVLEAGHGAGAPRFLGALFQGLAVEDDLLAVELLLAAPERHSRLPRIRPHTGEQAGLGLEANQPHARSLSLIGLEYEFGFEESSAIDHRLPALAFLLDRIAGAWM